MSIKLMSQVWESYTGPAGRKLVLLCLADFANDAGMAWPSRKTIARKSNLSRTATMDHLRALKAEGWLTEQGFSGDDYSSSRRYRVAAPRAGIRPPPGRNPAPPGPESPPDPGQNPAPPGPESGPNPPVNHQEPPGGEVDTIGRRDGGATSEHPAPPPPPVSPGERKREKARLEAAMFRALARLGVAVDRPSDREAWKGLLLTVRPSSPDEAAGIVGLMIDLYRDATGKEMRWPSEARTWIKTAARTYRNQAA